MIELAVIVGLFIVASVVLFVAGDREAARRNAEYDAEREREDSL